MKTTYGKKDIIHVLKGATFLGAGGGGSLEYGMKLLQQLEDMGYEAQFDLLSVDEMKDGEYAGMVAALGKPTAIDPAKLAEDLPASFKGLKIAASTDGHDLKYLYSGEMGGFNTMVPIFLSIISGKDPAGQIGVVDADANGRAVPELGTCLTNARGIGPAPLAMAGHKEKKAQYRYLSWPKDAASAEQMARKLGGSWYDLVGFSTWLMSSSEIEENAGTNYIAYARRIGEALENKEMPLYDALHSVMPQLKELCCGTIEKIILDEAGGFDKGRIIIGTSGTDEKICILFQNESLAVGKYEKETVTDIYMTVPDLISMVDTQTRKPLTNDNTVDIEEGQAVTVFLSPAHYYWWDNKKAYECFRHVLENNGYKGEFVRYNPLYEKNRGELDQNRAMLLQLAYASKDQNLEDNLAKHMQENLYDEDKIYVERLVPRGFFSEEESSTMEPAVTEQDMLRDGPEILQLAKERYTHGEIGEPWAGHYISHFADEKTTRAAREAASRPVFDAFDPAVLLSLALAENVGIITWPQSMVPTLERRIAGAGLDGRITAVVGIETKDLPAPEEIAKAAEMLMNRGIQCVILGRSYFAGDVPEAYHLAEEVQALLGDRIPVVDVNKVGARWLELNTHMGYFHSRLSYFTPPAKNV